MERFVYVFVLFLFSTLAFGQGRERHFETFENGDTLLYCKWRIELAKQLEIEPIQKTKYARYFRLWSNEQVIDLWEGQVGVTNGIVTS